MSVTTMLSGWVGGHSKPEPVTLRDDGAQGEILAGEFMLNLVARRAYLRGLDLHLSTAEFDLLHFLLTHRKMMVTQQTVLSTASDSVSTRRAEFLKNLLSLKKKLDEVSGAEHFLHVEPLVFYEFDLQGRKSR